MKDLPNRTLGLPPGLTPGPTAGPTPVAGPRSSQGLLPVRIVRLLAMVIVCFLITFSVRTSVLAAQDESSELEEAKATQVLLITEHLNSCLVQVEFVGGTQSTRTTGTLIDSDGYLLTHATGFKSAPDTILITTSTGKQQLAQWIAVDRIRNLLLLKTDPVPVDAFCVPFDLTELEVGQTVLALGKMLDAKSINVSEGIVSAKDRIWGKATQADAKIGPLNYGGPLVDLQGRLVGILTPLSMNVKSNQEATEWYDSGIGFAANLSDYQQQMERLKQGNDILSGVSGIQFKQTNVNSGTFPISAVAPMSPAAEAGLVAGDKILEVNGQVVESLADFYQQYFRLAAGDPMHVKVEGEKGLRDISMTLVDRLPAIQSGLLGIVLGDLNSSLEVLAVATDNVPFKVGDNLVKAQDTPLKSNEELTTLLRSLPVGSKIELEVLRNGEALSVKTSLQSVRQCELDDQQIDSLLARFSTNGRTESEIAVPELIGTGLLSSLPVDVESKLERPLLVLLRDSLQSDGDVIENWRSTADDYQLDLLVIGPQEQRWTTDDLDCVDRLVAEAVGGRDKAGSRNLALLSLGDSQATGVALMESSSLELKGFAFWSDKLQASSFDSIIEAEQGGIVNPKRLALLLKVKPDWWENLNSEELFAQLILTEDRQAQPDAREQAMRACAKWLWSLKLE